MGCGGSSQGKRPGQTNNAAGTSHGSPAPPPQAISTTYSPGMSVNGPAPPPQATSSAYAPATSHSGQAARGAPPPQAARGGGDASAELQVISSSLGLPPGTSAQEVVKAGLAAEDLEVLRHAICAGPKVGVQGPELQTASERLRSAMAIPGDWNMERFASGKFLSGGCGGRKESTVVAYESQPQTVHKEMQSLFDATYRKVYTRDRRGAPIPDHFKIKEVHRVMNSQVWHEYCARKQIIRERCQGNRPSVPDGAHTMNHLSKSGAMHLPVLDADINEAWLFHGTTKEASIGIAENDFRLDFSGSNAGTLYGKGIYLAENATKSDEYGEGPKGPASANGEETEAAKGYEAPRPPPGPPPPLVRESYILVCRSALGRVKYTDEQKPDPDQLQQGAIGGSYESVLGDRLKKNGTFREIVVYDDDLVYPEYIVKYERVFFHERFAFIYRQMLARKKRGQFRGPNPDEITILRSLWNVYGMPNNGKINKWQLLDLLKAINQPPMNEGEDLDATFSEWDTKRDGIIDYDEFMQEMTQRVNDGIEC